MLSSPLQLKEQILLWRTRSEMSQADFAEQIGIPTQILFHAEKGFIPTTLKFPTNVEEIEAETDEEDFLILRRRHKMSQTDIGKELGLCRFTVSKMEKGKINSDRLKDFWETYIGGCE